VWREAAALGVNGWVRNRRDGTVEALLLGASEAVDQLLKRVSQGPRWGRVDRMDVTAEAVPAGIPEGFVIRSDR
jgi:acylphosphatase